MTSKKDQMQDSKKRVAFQVRLFAETPQSEDALPTEIHVIPTGEWDHPVYGEMKIGEEEIAQFVDNFRAGIRKGKIPVTAGHSVLEELPAIGWFTDLIDRGKEGLWASIEWTARGKELLLEGAYKYFSPEYFPAYEDPATGQRYKNVLVGGALTNHPFFRELNDVVVFSEPQIINQPIELMDIKEILAKSPEERSDEEVSFLEENAADLTDEQKTQLDQEAAGDGDGAGEGDGGEGDDPDAGGDGDGAGDGAGEGDGEGEPAGVAASQKGGKHVLISASELSALRSAADQGKQAFSKMQQMEVREKVGKMTFSATNPDGRFLPKQADAVTAFMLTLSEKQRDQFTNIVNNMPKVTLSTEELGDGGAVETKASEVATQKAEELVKASDGKLSFSDAIRQVYRDNPELAEQEE